MLNQNDLVEYVRSGMMSLYDGLEAYVTPISIVRGVISKQQGVTFEIRYSPDGIEADNRDTLFNRLTILKELSRAGLAIEGARPEFVTVAKSKHFHVRFVPYPTPRKYEDGNKQLLECLGHAICNKVSPHIEYKGELDVGDKGARICGINALKYELGKKILIDEKYTIPKAQGGPINFQTSSPVNQLIEDNPFGGLFDLLDSSLQATQEFIDESTLKIIREAYGVEEINQYNQDLYYVGLTYL